MKKTIKLLVSVLCIALLITSFASCESKKDDVLTRAGDKLDKVKITELNVQKVDQVNVYNNAMSDSERLSVVEQMRALFEKTEKDVTYYDGSNMRIQYDDDSYAVIVGNVSYYDYFGFKYKAKLPTSDIEDAATSVAAEFGFDWKNGLDCFESYDIEEHADGSVTINASGNKNGDFVSGLLSGSNTVGGATSNFETNVLNVEYVIEIDANGRYSSIHQKSTIQIIMGVSSMGASAGYDIVATRENEMTFDYDDVMTIKAPENANEYEEMDLSELW